ncbi:MAG: nitrilase-related carbon-nitrogen hydrolase [Myxococcota bacterium]
MKTLDRNPALWLIVAAALLALSHLRYGLDPLAWVAFVPLLRFVRLQQGWRSDLTVLVATMVGMTLATAKIATAPIPLMMAPMYGVPMGLMLGLPVVLFGRLRRRLDGPGAPLLFPALAVVSEWIQYALTEIGTWGVAANTQLDDLALLQIASVTGLAGVSFVIYLTNVALEDALDGLSSRRPRLGWLAAAAATWLVVTTLGSARLAAFETATDVVRVAAVGTDATFGGHPLPSPAEQATIGDGLERRTRQAAADGAEIVVWNEGATFVLPAQRAAAEARWAALADELDIELVAAWVVIVQDQPLRYENLSITFRPDGSATDAYLKRHPVPGEPAVRGEAPMTVVDVDATQVGTAICYDADFPRLGLEHARADIDLLALPSSDWRGIDPIHTEMARLRAIEGGHSILRSTRMGLSAGIDPVGRFRGAMSWFDSGERVMSVALPRHGTTTIYGVLGDWFVALCAALVTLGTALALRLLPARGFLGAWLPSPSSESARS